ncbi:hypothetical protein ACF1AX_31330 [Streptomyces sp. NPDC014802]|uniref:hypothetical protein n=1 Tax=Streptomyces sp. NPDC014802 TaxID=3364917 RepID=UPI003702EAD5
MNDHPIPRLFVLQRDRDITGVSGSGPVADGVQFQDGTVILRWRARPSVAVWHDLELMLSVHGHDGATRVVWADEEAVTRREAVADIVEAFDVPAAAMGTEAARALLHRQITRALTAEHLRRADQKIVDSPEGHCTGFADAVMPFFDELLEERDRAQRTAGRAYQLADCWEAAHGAARFLVRAAGAELREVLDDEPGGIRGLLEHVGIDTLGRDITVAGRVVDAGATDATRPVPESACHHSGRHPGFTCAEVDQSQPYWNVRWAQENSTQRYGAPSEQPCTEHRGEKRRLLGCNGPDPDDDPPVQCWHTEPGSPCDWTICRQPERLAAGDRGTDPADEAPNQPLTGIEVREPCPYCPGAPMFPRSELPAHLDSRHARVVAVLARGGDLDEQLAPCTLPHEMEA